MKIELTDLAGLPEGLKSVVTQDGEKSFLDLSLLMPTEDLTGLKGALQKERQNAQKWSKFGDPESVAQKIADLQAQVQNGGKSDDDSNSKLSQIKDQYEAKLTEAGSRLEKLMRANAESTLKAELAKAGVIPDGVDILASFATQRLQIGTDGAVKVLSANGEPMIGSGPDHGATLSDLASELATSIPALVRDAGKGGGGKQPNSSGGKHQPIKRTEFDAMTPAEQQAAVASGASFID